MLRFFKAMFFEAVFLLLVIGGVGSLAYGDSADKSQGQQVNKINKLNSPVNSLQKPKRLSGSKPNSLQKPKRLSDSKLNSLQKPKRQSDSKPNSLQKPKRLSDSKTNPKTNPKPSPKNHGRLVNFAVGEVGGEPVTARDVQINSVLERVLYPSPNFLSNRRQKNLRKQWELQINDSKFRGAIVATLLDKAIQSESLNLSLNQIRGVDINRSYQKVRSQLRNWPYWKRLGVDSKELRVLVENKLRSKNFIRFKAESTLVPITEAEEKVYYRNNRQKFKGLSFSSSRKNINAFLARRNSDRRLREWFIVLKRRYNVRNFTF